MRDEFTGATAAIITSRNRAGQGSVNLGGIFQFGFDKKITFVLWASVSKKWKIFEGFFATFRSCIYGKVLLMELLKFRRLELYMWLRRQVGQNFS